MAKANLTLICDVYSCEHNLIVTTPGTKHRQKQHGFIAKAS